MEQFFRKFQKHVILGQNGHFLARLAKIGQNENFYQKSGRAIFLPLLSPNFMPSFRKIVGAVSEINSLRTDGRTDGQRWNHTTGRFRWFNIYRITSIYRASWITVITWINAWGSRNYFFKRPSRKRPPSQITAPWENFFASKFFFFFIYFLKFIRSLCLQK